jgi:preprotein translocase subunit SecE
MAEQMKKDAPAKAKEKKPGFGQKASRFFRELKSEIKKIVWPSKKTVFNNTIVVLAAMAVIGVVVWLFDWILVFVRGIALGF